MSSDQPGGGSVAMSDGSANAAISAMPVNGGNRSGGANPSTLPKGDPGPNSRKPQGDPGAGGSRPKGDPPAPRGGGKGDMVVDTGLTYSSRSGGPGSNGADHGQKWVACGSAGLSGTNSSGAATGPIVCKPRQDNATCGLPPATPPPGDTTTFDTLYFSKTQFSFKSDAGGLYTMLQGGGKKFTFDINGKLKTMVGTGGREANFTFDGDRLKDIRIPGLGGVGKSNAYVYDTNPAGMTSELKFEVDDDPVLKTTYGYTDGNLTTVKLWENRAPVGAPEADWGSEPISTTFYSYHPGTNRMRHVIPPQIHRQMMNNGIDPEEATESQLNEYAASEFAEYDSNNRVTLFYTSGRRYQQRFSYRTGFTTGSAFTVWATCTEVIRPDGSVMTCYYNRSGQLMLKMIQDDGKTWYPLCQQFQEGSGRILLSATGSAITGIDEGTTGLVILANGTDAEGLITVYEYNAQGYLKSTKIQNGTGGTPIPQEALEYEPCPVTDHGTIYVVNKRTTYRNDNGGDEIVTTYDYEYHDGTNQISQKTTYLPKVPTGENGTNTQYHTESHYDELGALIRTVDELGVATTYEYDAATGGMTKMTQDPTGLNLVTDYELDRRGRTILALGPEHEVDLAGTPTALRTCRWTYFQDDIEGTWTFNGYRTTVGPVVDQIVGPVSINRPNLPPPADMAAYAGWRQSSLIQAVYEGEGIPAADTVFGQETWTRWSVGLSDRASEYKEQWTYFNIPLGGYGHQSENYGRKLFAYDSAGRQNWTMCAGATIDQTTYNAMNWPVQEELGTVAGLSVTTVREFDVNGNVTKITLPVDTNTANDRVTDNTYDFRNRLATATNVVEQSAGSSSTWTYISRFVYDNRNFRIGTTMDLNSLGHFVSTDYTGYDVLGRLYRSQYYAVHGTIADTPQVSNTYYDATGRIARSAPSGSKLFTINKCDAVGRLKKSFQAWPVSGDSPTTDPASLAHAVVMEQQEMEYDDGGNLVSTISRQRFDDDPDTDIGELGNATTAPKARVSYVAGYVDAVGRPVAVANYGTNGGASWSRSQTIPMRSDIILVNSTFYDTAGNTTATTNPADITNSRFYDDAGRLVTTVENDVTTGSRTTHYEYTDDGWLTKLKSENPDTGLQVTEWVRGVSIAQGSTINSNRLVFQKIYPDSTGTADRITYLYDRQLQVVGMTDQNSTVHVYHYDKLGRLLVDQVEAFGHGVDTTVGRITTTYNDQLLVASQDSTSADGATSVNHVLYEYNAFHQLVTETQRPNGASAAPSIPVAYEYANGSDNTTRLTRSSIISSVGVSLTYGSTKADALSRPNRIDYASPASFFVTAYLGLRTWVNQKVYSAESSTVPISEWTMQNGSTGDAGDKYTGLDRFGRLVETIWKNTSGDQVHSRYGRNRVGGVEWRRDDKAHAMSVNTQDNYYWYDGLQQVTRHDRGNLVPSFGPPYTGIQNDDLVHRQQQELFTFDETGNWNSDYSKNPAPDGSPTLDQSRVNNRANQIVSLAGPEDVVQPAYDRVGNMTTIPKPGTWDQGYDLVWDAWNRVVMVKSGETPVAAYTYDAKHRRVTTTVGGVAKNFIYDNQWRVLEERAVATPTVIDQKYSWNPLNRWNLVRRLRSTVAGSLNEVLYPLKDYLDPVALIDTTGAVVERYSYDAFGLVGFMDTSFASRTSSSYDWNFLFHAEFRDVETGLYNYGYRYYHPNLGRWISRDPIGDAGGSNLYGFVLNRSVNNIDVVGLFYEFPDSITTGEGYDLRHPECTCSPDKTCPENIKCLSDHLQALAARVSDALDPNLISFVKDNSFQPAGPWGYPDKTVGKAYLDHLRRLPFHIGRAGKCINIIVAQDMKGECPCPSPLEALAASREALDKAKQIFQQLLPITSGAPITPYENPNPNGFQSDYVVIGAIVLIGILAAPEITIPALFLAGSLAVE